MSTLDLYMPTMREAPGRFYLPVRASVAALVSAVLLIGGLTWAARYPVHKAQEAIARLATYNGLIRDSNTGTQAALTRLQGLIDGQPEWLQKAVAPTMAAVRSQLDDAVPIDPAQILDAAAAQQAAYDKAQALIASSPFAGLKVEEVPLTTQGKAYLAALKAKPPARFEYQRLTDGVGVVLKAYHAALVVQDQAVQFAHRIDVQLHGDKAAPAPAPVLDTSPAANLFRSPPALKDDDESVLQQILGSSAAAKADRLPPVRHGTEYPNLFGKAKTSTPAPAAKSDPVAEAARQQQEAAERQQHEAEQAKARAAAQAAEQHRQAQRKALAAEKAKLQAKLAAEKAQLEAQQEAARQARAKQEAAARAAAKAKAAAQAKKRECTSSIFARAKCAAQGYNPLTGEKRH